MSMILLFCGGVFFSAAASTKSDYRRAFKKHTRSDELYQNVGLYASISWYATVLSPEFARAQAGEAARIYHYTPKEQEDFYRAELSKSSGQLRLFLSFYAFDRKSSDITKKGNPWQLKLVKNGQEYQPVKIEKVDKPTQLEKWFFPYINIWSVHYYITFPVALGDCITSDISCNTSYIYNNTSPLSLEVRGPFGHGTLVWK